MLPVIAAGVLYDRLGFGPAPVLFAIGAATTAIVARWAPDVPRLSLHGGGSKAGGAFLLAVAVLAMGLWPLPVTEVMHASVNDLLQRVALRGERETGATLHEMVEKPDAGRIAGQEAVPIGPNDSAAEVFARVTDAAGLLHIVPAPGVVE